MPHGTDQQPEQHSPEHYEPQLGSVATQPATVAACQADYAAGADIRTRLGWTDDHS
ncbi:hypothetical protein [Streptomyces sp.]|uniref:hypothetical protein n=1 Tax=Streptomyces sp. TaxID=1931 RepID=UPI002D2F18DC|nr:hypothetical protein [Streptomyces sp.]HZF92058.1 hypothetical protein [Streptomyces sp.]